MALTRFMLITAKLAGGWARGRRLFEAVTTSDSFFYILVKTTIGHGYGYISSLSFLMVTVVAQAAEYNNRKANV